MKEKGRIERLRIATEVLNQADEYFIANERDKRAIDVFTYSYINDELQDEFSRGLMRELYEYNKKKRRT
jgi:hypothetical protein